MGTGRPNLPSPVSCIPCPRAFFLGFFPYRLQVIKYCHVICPYLFRFPLFWIRTAISRPSPLPLDLNPSHPLSFPTVSPIIFLMWVACELFSRDFCLERLVQLNCYEELLRYAKTGNKKHAPCFATLLQNELNSDVARFTTHVQTC